MNNNNLTIANLAFNSLLCNISKSYHLTSESGTNTRIKAGSMVNSFSIQVPTTSLDKHIQVRQYKNGYGISKFLYILLKKIY